MPRHNHHITGYIGCDNNCRPHDNYHSPQCSYIDHCSTNEEHCCDEINLSELVTNLRMDFEELKEYYNINQNEYLLFNENTINKLNSIDIDLTELKEKGVSTTELINQTILDYKEADNNLETKLTNLISELVKNYEQADLELKNSLIQADLTLENKVNNYTVEQVNSLRDLLINRYENVNEQLINLRKELSIYNVSVVDNYLVLTQGETTWNIPLPEQNTVSAANDIKAIDFSTNDNKLIITRSDDVKLEMTRDEFSEWLVAGSSSLATDAEVTTIVERVIALISQNPTNGTEDSITSILSYGAVGDGVTDDTQAFKDALANEKYINIPPNKYLITEGIEIKDKSPVIFAHGAEIIYDNPSPESAFLSITGSYEDEIILKSDAVLAGDGRKEFTTISTVTPHGLELGDRVLITSWCDAMSVDAGIWRLGTPTGNTITTHFSEVIVVNDIVSSTAFTSENQLEFPFYQANKPNIVLVGDNREHTTIRKINFVTDSAIHGLTIHGKSGGIGSRANSIQYMIAERPVLRDVKLYKYSGHGQGIRLINCWQGYIDNCYIDNSHTFYESVDNVHVPDNHFATVSSWHTTYNNCGSVHGGQIFDTSYGSNSILDVTNVRTPSTYTTIQNCKITSSLDNAATNHSGSYKSKFDNNDFVGNARYVLIRSPWTTLSNNRIHIGKGNVNTYGIYLGEPTIQNCRIIGNEIVGADRAIRINTLVDRGDEPNFKYLNIEIEGNTFQDCNIALFIQEWGYSKADTGILNPLAKESLGVIFKDNIFYNTDSTSVVIHVGEYNNGVQIIGNKFYTDFEDGIINLYNNLNCVIKDNLVEGPGLDTALIIGKVQLDDTPINRQLSPSLKTGLIYYNNINKSKGWKINVYSPFISLEANGDYDFSGEIPNSLTDINLNNSYASYMYDILGEGTTTKEYSVVSNDLLGEIKTQYRLIGGDIDNPDYAATRTRAQINYIFPSNQGIVIANSTMYPIVDSEYALGWATFRWSNIYSSTDVINTSDETLKTEFSPLTINEKNAAIEIKNSIGIFKFIDSVAKKGKDARKHTGVGAQTVRDILKKHGLNPFEYSFLCYDKWDDEYDEDNNLVKEAGDIYSIRYSELIMFILAGTI